MANDQIRSDEIFVVAFRMKGQIEGLWHVIDEASSLEDAKTIFHQIVDSDRKEGATTGARWRITQEKGTRILQTIEDVTLIGGALIPTGNIPPSPTGH